MAFLGISLDDVKEVADGIIDGAAEIIKDHPIIATAVAVVVPGAALAITGILAADQLNNETEKSGSPAEGVIHLGEGHGNIVGEGFNETIIQQIEARQKVFGSLDRTKYLKFLNARTPWIKLSSAVNVTDKADLKGIDPYNVIAYRNNELAREYVLFGGTSTFKTGAFTQRSGLFDAYDVGDQSQGYRPMPGITSITSKNRNRGSVRESTINIKAYNTTQFNIIDLLYLRLGYTVLLEWGHSIYIDNNLEEKTMNESDTLTNRFVTQGGFNNQKELLNAIAENKKKLYGNYDAIYGKVSNFSWTFETDGSYTITLTVLSLGDVIESLKINTIAKGKTSDEKKTEEEEGGDEAKTNSDVINSYKNKDAISKLFYQAYQKLKNTNNELSSNDPEHPVSALTNEAATELGFTCGGDFISIQEYSGWVTSDPFIYIRLGGFLHYLKNNSLIYSGETSLIDIDNSEERNIIFTTPYVISADPRVCIIKTDITINNVGWFDELTQGSTDAYKIFANLPFDFKKTIKNITVGQLMNIYINVPFILKSMDELRDDKGNLSLYSLLEKICAGINDSLGNINSIEPVIDDEDNNRLYLIDETALPEKDQLLENFGYSTKNAIFEIFGYTPNNSTFVNNLSIKTEITNDIATMITVGAQANGQAVGEDATAFSKWNKGLIDRIIPEKNDTKKSVEEEKPEEEKPDYEDTIEEYEDFVDSMETQKFTDSIDSFKSVLKNFLTYIQGQQSQKEEKASGTVGFIPVSLNLDIVGLSGMKILQKFTINQKFLPYNYPESIEFLVKGLSQKVDNNGWTTSIESLSIPKDISAGANPPLPASQNTFTSTDEGTNTGTVPQNSTNAAGGTPKKTSGAKYSVKNIPATQDLCAAVSGEIKGPIVKSKIINAYKSNVKGKKEFIDKLEKAYDALVKQGIKLDIGDSYRSYDVQRQAYITNEAARAAGKKVDNKAHPCKGYHVLGQAIDLNQTASQKKDIQSHGKIYKALYDAGLRRIGNEWWHWSIGEATHTINQQFTDHGGDIKNYNRY